MELRSRPRKPEERHRINRNGNEISLSINFFSYIRDSLFSVSQTVIPNILCSYSELFCLSISAFSLVPFNV